VIGIIAANRELATQAVLMRKYGQEIIAATAGKKIHGTGAVPGGINKNLSIGERDALLKGPHPMNADAMVAFAQGALDFFKDYYAKHKVFIDTFSSFPSNHLSLVRPDGALDFYDGVLRAVDADGRTILHDVECQEYLAHIREEVRSWTYMKFPYLRHLGPEKGWYRVGPLARLNTAEFIPSPLAQAEFEGFRKVTGGKPNNMCLHTHWARLIETLHAAEMIRTLLNDADLQGNDLIVTGKRETEGIGIIEAPRGTLFHHYRVSPEDQIVMANLIVSTTNNNEPMNRAVNHVAKALMTKAREITEGMMNAVEVAIRAYDPCLSCATHAYGSMALKVSLLDAADNVIAQRIR
jgi:NAD-reducing hydrogenase large subunit